MNNKSFFLRFIVILDCRIKLWITDRDVWTAMLCLTSAKSGDEVEWLNVDTYVAWWDNG